MKITQTKIMNQSLYFVSREDGTVSGPHHPNIIRREVDAGTLTLDTLIALEGTQDWLPIIEWGTAIIPLAPKKSVAHYAAVIPTIQEKKSAPRVFWAVMCIIIGLVKCAAGIFLMRPGSYALSSGLTAIGLLWGIAGTSELIRQSRKV